jgi:hypothetical protein
MKKIISFFCSLLLVTGIIAQITPAMKMVDSTTVFGKIDGMISRGTILKTSTFHFYEINDKINQKPAVATPVLVVYQEGKKYKMQVQGIDRLLACNRISEVIESNIDGDFKGWDGNSSFRLVNQQEWKQDGQTSSVFANLYRPAVLIYLSAEGYKMKIEGLNEEPILVKRLR